MKDRELLGRVNRLEKEATRAYRMLLVRLFSGEYEALTVLKMKEVADELEDGLRRVRAVANTSRRSPSRNPDRWQTFGSSRS